MGCSASRSMLVMASTGVLCYVMSLCVDADDVLRSGCSVRCLSCCRCRLLLLTYFGVCCCFVSLLFLLAVLRRSTLIAGYVCYFLRNPCFSISPALSLPTQSARPHGQSESFHGYKGYPGYEPDTPTADTLTQQVRGRFSGHRVCFRSG